MGVKCVVLVAFLAASAVALFFQYSARSASSLTAFIVQNGVEMGLKWGCNGVAMGLPKWG